MVYRKKRKLVIRRKRKKRTMTTSVPRAFPMGKRYRWTTRYVTQYVTLDPGAGGIPVNYVFSMNGLYDPNITGVGHQPIGFDQFVGIMYDHYTVVASKATVTFNNTDTDASQIAVISLKDTNTTSTNIEQIIENGMSKHCVLGQSNAQSVKTLSLGCNVSKFFGKDNVLDSTTYQGSASANPSDQVYLHLTVGPQGTGSNEEPVYAMVVIDYLCYLTEPKQLGQS